MFEMDSPTGHILSFSVAQPIDVTGGFIQICHKSGVGIPKRF